jgi:hypothetical protein
MKGGKRATHGSSAARKIRSASSVKPSLPAAGKTEQPDAFSLIPHNWADLAAGDCEWDQCDLGADLADGSSSGESYENHLQQEHISDADRELAQILEADLEHAMHVCEEQQQIRPSVTMPQGQLQREMTDILTDVGVANRVTEYKKQIDEQDARKEKQLKTPEGLLLAGPAALYKVWDSSLVGMHTSGHSCVNKPDDSANRQKTEQSLSMPFSAAGLFKEYSSNTSNCRCANDKQCRACRAVRQPSFLQLVRHQHIDLLRQTQGHTVTYRVFSRHRRRFQCLRL